MMGRRRLRKTWVEKHKQGGRRRRGRKKELGKEQVCGKSVKNGDEGNVQGGGGGRKQESGSEREKIKTEEKVKNLVRTEAKGQKRKILHEK